MRELLETHVIPARACRWQLRTRANGARASEYASRVRRRRPAASATTTAPVSARARHVGKKERKKRDIDRHADDNDDARCTHSPRATIGAVGAAFASAFWFYFFFLSTSQAHIHERKRDSSLRDARAHASETAMAAVARMYGASAHGTSIVGAVAAAAAAAAAVVVAATHTQISMAAFFVDHNAHTLERVPFSFFSTILSV